MDFEINIQEFKTQKTAGVRAKTTLDKVPAKVILLLHETTDYLDSIGVRAAGNPFSIYYEVGSFLVDLEVGYPILEDIVGNDRVKQNVIDGGKCAVANYVGPHKDIANAHRAVHSWMHDHDIKASGQPAREIFITDLREVDPDSDCTAQSVWPVIHESRAEKRRQKKAPK